MASNSVALILCEERRCLPLIEANLAMPPRLLPASPAETVEEVDGRLGMPLREDPSSPLEDETGEESAMECLVREGRVIAPRMFEEFTLSSSGALRRC